MKIKIISILLSIGFLTTNIIRTDFIMDGVPVIAVRDLAIIQLQEEKLEKYFLQLIHETELITGLVVDKHSNNIKISHDKINTACSLEEKTKKLKEACATYVECQFSNSQIIGLIYISMAEYFCKKIDESNIEKISELEIIVESFSNQLSIDDKLPTALDNIKNQLKECGIHIQEKHVKEITYHSFFEMKENIEKVLHTKKIDENILEKLYQMYIGVLIAKEMILFFENIKQNYKVYISKYQTMYELTHALESKIHEKGSSQEIAQIQQQIFKILSELTLLEYSFFPCATQHFIQTPLLETLAFFYEELSSLFKRKNDKTELRGSFITFHNGALAKLSEKQKGIIIKLFEDCDENSFLKLEEYILEFKLDNAESQYDVHFLRTALKYIAVTKHVHSILSNNNQIKS